MARGSSSSNVPLIIIGIIATISIGAVTWHIVQQQQAAASSRPQDPSSKKKKKSLQLGNSKGGETVATADDDGTTVDKIHKKIEDLDKKGKVLYKDKNVSRRTHGRRRRRRRAESIVCFYIILAHTHNVRTYTNILFFLSLFYNSSWTPPKPLVKPSN